MRILALANRVLPEKLLPIMTLEQSLAHLGPHRLQTLMLSASTASPLDAPPDPLTTRIRHEGLIAAELATRLIRMLVDKAGPITWAFTMARFAGIQGLAQIDPDPWRNSKTLAELTTAETERFGIHHATAAARMIRSWGARGPIGSHIETFSPWDGESELERHPKLEYLPAIDYLMEEFPLHQQTPSSAFGIRLSKVLGLADLDGDAQAWLERARQHPDRRLRHAGEASDFTEADRAERLAENAITMIEKLQAARLEAKSEHQAQIRELRGEAFTDGLTGLLNRRGLEALAAQRLGEAATAGQGVCCILLDLDDFKPINDTWGHDIGDRALRGTGMLLRKSVRRRDLIARIGGDEFVVFVDGIDLERARQVCDQIMGRFKSYRVRLDEDHEQRLQVSIGAVWQPAKAIGAFEPLLKGADRAMYRSKKSGKNQLTFLANPDLNAPVENSDDLEAAS
ncbi:MAG: GGDEF domain-containing protein [Phycisphaeraceae bacterium]|nr:GGDEF domain-containing protein [Phycisphaeraceae bacterium]